MNAKEGAAAWRDGDLTQGWVDYDRLLKETVQLGRDLVRAEGAILRSPDGVVAFPSDLFAGSRDDLARFRALLDVFTTTEPLRVEDLASHPAALRLPAVGFVSNLLVVPIPMGIAPARLCVLNKQNGATFTPEDEGVARAVAAAVGKSLENALLLHRQSRQQRWLEGTGHITELLFRDVDLPEAMRVVIERIREISGADLATIALIDPAAPDTVEYAAVSGLGLEAGRGQRSRIRGISAVSVREGRPIVVEDLPADPRYDPPPGWARSAHTDVGPAAFVPLIAANGTLGVLMVAWSRTSPHVPHARLEQPQLRAFADQTALVLQRIRTEQERDRRERWLRVIAEVGRLLIGPVDRDHTTDVLLRRLREVSGADFTGLFLIDPSEESRLSVLRFEGPNLPPVPPDLRMRRVGLIDRVLTSGQPLVSLRIPDLSQYEPQLEWAEALTDLGLGMMHPLVEEDETLGVLFTGWLRGSPHEMSAAREAEQVRTFADLLAFALQRLRLQDDRERMLVLQDRNRIVNELTDLVLQYLFAAGLRLKSALPLSPTSAVEEQVGETIVHLDEISDQIRSAVFGEEATPPTVS